MKPAENRQVVQSENRAQGRMTKRFIVKVYWCSLAVLSLTIVIAEPAPKILAGWVGGAVAVFYMLLAAFWVGADLEENQCRDRRVALGAAVTILLFGGIAVVPYLLYTRRRFVWPTIKKSVLIHIAIIGTASLVGAVIEATIKVLEW